MKNQIIFITGTDTGVGKTVTTATLAYYFWQRKKSVGVVKAIQTGFDNDLDFIQKQAGLKKNQLFCPLYLRQPLAPQQAAELERKSPIDVKKILRSIKDFSRKNQITLVEGAGGLLVPIRPQYFMLDLIKDLRAKVIIVSRIGLGTINHTLLTIQAIKQKRLPLWGIIYNACVKPGSDYSVRLNPDVIRQISRVPTLGILPYQKKIDIPKLVKYIRI